MINVCFSQGYNTIVSNTSIPIPPSGVTPATEGITSPLPPMSSLRGAPTAPSPIAVTPSSMMYPGHNSPTVQSPGDTLGKALASVR